MSAHWTRRTWLGAAAALGTAACTGDDERTVRFWAMGREGEVAAELLADFEREHPGIRVRIEQLPWSAAHEKLLTAFAGNATPDVAQMGNTWLPEFVALDALEPLDARVQASPDVVAADYFSGIWDTNRIQGRLFGVPWYVDTRLLFYRRDLLARAGFTAPPRDWAEWMQMLHAIKRLVGPQRYAILLPLNEYDPLVALALQQDEPLLRDDGRYGNFRSAGFQRTWRFYLSMYEQGLAHSPNNEYLRSGVIRALLKLDRRDDAIAKARAWLAQDPGALYMKGMLGVVLTQAGKAAEAETLLQESLADPIPRPWNAGTVERKLQ